MSHEVFDEPGQYSPETEEAGSSELLGQAMQSHAWAATAVLFAVDGEGKLAGEGIARRSGSPEPDRVESIRRLKWSLDEVSAAPVRTLTGTGGDPRAAVPSELLDCESTWCFVPLRGRKGNVGVLALGAGSPPAEPPDPVAFEGWAQKRELELLWNRSNRASADLGTVQEVARVVLSSTNLEDLLTAVSRLGARAIHATWSATWLVQGDETELVPVASTGAVFEAPGMRGQLLRLAQTCAQNHRPIRLDHAAALERLGADSLGAVVIVPLVAFEQTVGVLAVGQKVDGEFDLRDEQLLSTIAAQASVAVRTAQLYRDVRRAEKRLREAQSHLLQTEKLAALGELSAKVAHEIRNPLSAVGGFARRIQKSLAKDDPNAQYADLIVKEIERLEAILTEQLQFARMSRPRLSPLDLNDVMRETIVLLREEADRKGVRLLEEYAGNLPQVLLDPDKLEQVFLNILRNALAASGDGNRIQVRTVRHGGDVRVEIANDGDPLPGEALESLFVPFATTRPGGTGLGLAVARQIVQDHGGEIQVRTGQSWSVIFTVSFPIRENQDRRRTARERRTPRDRRAA